MQKLTYNIWKVLVLIYETECFYVRNSVWAPTLLSSVKISVKKLGSALILSIDPLNMKIIQLIDLVLWFWSWISGMKRLTSLRIYFILLDSDNLASSSGIIQTSYILPGLWSRWVCCDFVNDLCTFWEAEWRS